MRLLYFSIALLLSLNIMAQRLPSNYLITTAGDSVYGNIELKNGVFFISEGREKKLVDAEQVKKIHSENFKGSVVVHCNLHLYTDDLVMLDLDFVPLRQKDTVLILKEMYSTNKINLYMGTDNFRTPYYFYKTPKDETPVQLVVRYSLTGGLSSYSNDRGAYRGNRSRMQLEVDKGYVNQLKNVMNDCTAIPDGMWELLDYRLYSFKSLIRKYNNCN